MGCAGGVCVPGTAGAEEAPDHCAAAMHATNIATTVQNDVSSFFISESIRDRCVDAPPLISEFTAAFGTPLAVVVQQRENRLTRHPNRHTTGERFGRVEIRGLGFRLWI